MPEETRSERTAGEGADITALCPSPRVAEERQYCVFRAGRECFCLTVLEVEEVVNWPQVTSLPLAPSFLVGIFNLRGAIVPIIDIVPGEGRRSDLPPRRVVVAKRASEDDRDDLRLGIAADEVLGTCTTAEPLLIDQAPRDVPHCCGVLRHSVGRTAVGSTVVPEDRLALALDLKRLAEAFPVSVI